jgi:hypothetical protein
MQAMASLIGKNCIKLAIISPQGYFGGKECQLLTS